MSRTGADLVVETLAAAGVKHLFTLSGNQILSVYDATIGRDIALIHTRHEAAAVHMADGWGRLTEQPGVALVTAGPGHCNALSALYVALMAESPVVLLSGHSPRSQRGKGAFQEMDQVAAAKPVTKAAWLVEDADTLDREVATALALASAPPPGPVHLSLPSDLLQTQVSTAARTAPKINLAKPAPVSSSVLMKVVQILTHASRPLIIAGPAMGRNARWKKVERLAEVTGIPALPMESPRGANDPWLHAARECLKQADVVLLLGKRLDFSVRFGTSFSERCIFIQIDLQPHPASDGKPALTAVEGDPAVVLEHLIREARKHTWQRGGWQSEVSSARNTTPESWESLRLSTQQPLHPLRVCAAVQPFLDQGGVLVCDGGEFGQWAQAGLEASCRLINGLSGSIGSALPLGMAAKLAHPERQVFVALGDGTFGFHALEFDTAVRCRLPFVALVGNDACWNAEHQLQVQQYGAERAIGCALLPSRYDKLAEALGGHGEFVQHPDELAPALTRAVESGLPACVNIAIDGVAAPVPQLKGH
jgi:thiamine pyrophosphate-dependent acetolactate synthase large subunit-like protein